MADTNTNILTTARQILRLLSSIVVRDTASLWGASEEFESLEDTVLDILIMLSDAGKQKVESDEVKSLLERLENVVYDTDDLVDEIFTVASQRRNMSGTKKVHNFLSYSSNPLFFQRKICCQVKKVTKTIIEILQEMPERRISFPEGIGVQTRREMTDSRVQEEVFGRNVEKMDIIKLMLEPEIKSEEKNVAVIPIVGVQGIGKTTLAQFVYNDKEVEQNFELRMWVCISHLFDPKLTVHKLTEAATGVPHPADHPIHQLLKELRKGINGKRFLLVLDDMVDGNLENWISLKHLLKGCAKDSCVLVTTCSEEVATTTCTDQPYHLYRLTEEDSWALLKRYAFHSSPEQHDLEIKELRSDIEAKCQGVPLFVRAIAHSLYVEPLDKWQHFNAENVLSGLKRELRIQSAARRQTDSFIPQEVVLGRDVEKKRIKAQLLKDNLEENLLVIPIVGIGGLGKTALAQLIFNDEEIQRHFYFKIWVCVTDISDLREIVEKIILSITTERPNLRQLDSLADHLRRELQGKQYLLILDDVWNEEEEQWERLKDLLSVGAKGSRIIVTTRSARVADITGSTEPHGLSILDENMSWSLFTKVALEQGKLPTDSEIIKIGKEIVKKCGGIPLVIRTIGSILSLKNPETEWQLFYDKELSKILDNEATVEASLRLSYDLLPPPLKMCFAYCGLFPKDHEIDVETLITLWISQGFIDADSEENLEELGSLYFLNLLRTSFFQEIKTNGWGIITKCKMPNLMHDLARFVAGNCCATLSIGGTVELKSLPRHVSFDFHIDSFRQIPLLVAKLTRIRTLILPRQVGREIKRRSSESVCDGIIKFKFLRMLELNNSGIKVLPNSIGELKHLRYLDLSQNGNIKALPNSISRLQNLHTLKLNHCNNLRTLPRDIKKLVGLRNLENESCYYLTHMPRGLSELRKLRTLSEFVLSKGSGSVSKQSCKLEELGELNHLRGELKIKHLRFQEGYLNKQEILYKKRCLQSLILIWDIDAATEPFECEELLKDLRPHPNLRELSLSSYGGVRFSSWLLLHTNLVKFSLSNCIKCICLPQLHHLFSLRILVVDTLKELEYISDETSRIESRFYLPSLRELRLTSLPKLNGWWKDAAVGIEDKTTFPRLSKLIVEDCPNLTSMPLFPSLEELLVLNNTSWEPFQQTMVAEEGTPRTSEFEASSSSSTSSTVAPLSKLSTLCIINMSTDDRNKWQFLPSLRSLTLDHLADINAFLEGLQQVTSLQKLNIWCCDSLREIPSWISDVKSLKTISIKLCPNLAIPPDRISLITSLQNMEVAECPLVSNTKSMLKDSLYAR